MPAKTARSARTAAEVGGSSRERILAEAERVFGAHGFDGASMRQLAEAADVPAALISYHFGSKEGLYRAVFERRVPTVVEQRLSGLAIAMSEQDLDRRLELVVKALVFPMLHLRARDRDPSFGRLLAHETMDPNSEQRGFIRDMFDPIARAVAEALRSALPTRTEAEIWWAYEFMLGAMVYVMGDAGRLERLTGGLCRPDDEAASVPHMVAFLTAGVRYGMPPRVNEGNRHTEPTKVTGGKTNATRDVPKGERIAARRRLVDGDTRIIDLAEAHRAAFGGPGLESVLSIAEGGDAALERAREAVKKAPADASVARADVRLRAPMQPPPQMRDCLCFELHLKQAFASVRKLTAMQGPDPEKALAEIERGGPPTVPAIFYKQPIYYKANRFAVIGTDDEVVWPAYSKFLDFELEFGVFIKDKVTDAPKEGALKHVFGYTIFNDMSARDAQALEMEGRLGPAKGKDFDTGNPMGPCLVTADEIPDPYNLTMIARVNGEEWGRGSSSTMYWKFEDLISYISRSETLYPGEFLGSGTVGNGCGLEHMRFIKPGDVIELEVERIGVLRNRVVAHA